MGPRVYEFFPFRLDADKFVLWRGGDVVPLTPKALSLLLALAEAGGDVVPKADLMARVWPDTAVLEANLSVTVAALRKALGPREGGGSWIQTVPRRGYRLDTPVRTPAGPRFVTLAVLPFVSLGRDTDPHVGLGLADALISRLTGLEGLRVRPTAAVTHLVGAHVDPRTAAAELGVDAVLTGTVRREGERLRLSLQLVPRAAGVEPWASRVDAPYTDVFDLEDRVAEEVAGVLHARLARSPGGRRRAAPPRLAWESYIRGRYFESWLDPDGVSKAIGHFAEAAAVDPRWAPPHAALADAHVLLAFGGAVPPPEAWERAMECVNEALDRDPELAEGHAVRAWIALFRDWNWAAARRSLDRALALEPESHVLHLLHALLLGFGGDVARARREIARTLEADPLSGLAAAAQALFHDPALDLRPDRALGYWSLALACIDAGRHDRAVTALRRAVELTDGGLVARAQLALALARAGDTAESRALIAELDALEGRAFVSRYQLGQAWVALGERERAQDELDRAATVRDPFLVLIGVDAGLAGLRGEPRFDALVARVCGREATG